MAIHENWSNHHSAFLYFFSFLPLNIDPLSSWRIPTVVNSPHLLSPICINILPFQEQEENGEPPERMLFWRENPKDKLGSLVEAAKKGQPPVGNWVEPQREEQSPEESRHCSYMPWAVIQWACCFLCPICESTLGTTLIGHPIAPELTFCEVRMCLVLVTFFSTVGSGRITYLLVGA